MQGRVKFFNPKKGFGFISVEGREKDIFVHYTGIKGTGRRDLADDDVVEFDVIKGERGDQATNCVKL